MGGPCYAVSSTVRGCVVHTNEGGHSLLWVTLLESLAGGHPALQLQSARPEAEDFHRWEMALFLSH